MVAHILFFQNYFLYRRYNIGVLLFYNQSKAFTGGEIGSDSLPWFYFLPKYRSVFVINILSIRDKSDIYIQDYI